MSSRAFRFGESSSPGPYNIALESSRPQSGAILTLRRAAQRDRWADQSASPVLVFRRMAESIRVAEPPLRFLHSEAVLSPAKLERFRAMTTTGLIESLRPGQSGALTTRPDGTVLEGHHRLVVLRERGIDVEVLPREVVSREDGV